MQPFYKAVDRLLWQLDWMGSGFEDCLIGRRRQLPVLSKIAITSMVFSVQYAIVKRVCKEHKIIHRGAMDSLKTDAVQMLRYVYMNFRFPNRCSAELGGFLKQWIEELEVPTDENGFGKHFWQGYRRDGMIPKLHPICLFLIFEYYWALKEHDMTRFQKQFKIETFHALYLSKIETFPGIKCSVWLVTSPKSSFLGLWSQLSFSLHGQWWFICDDSSPVSINHSCRVIL